MIVLAAGPMLEDSYPAGIGAYTAVHTVLENIVTTRNETGDKKLYFLSLPTQPAPYGEGWYPTADTHSAMSEALLALIREKNMM